MVPNNCCKLTTCPTTTPAVTPIEQKTPRVPLKCRGAISVKYIGKIVVVNPEANPTKIRPTIKISTEDKARQNWKHIAPAINKIAQTR
jgi:hypothetical protein